MKSTQYFLIQRAQPLLNSPPVEAHSPPDSADGHRQIWPQRSDRKPPMSTYIRPQRVGSLFIRKPTHSSVSFQPDPTNPRQCVWVSDVDIDLTTESRISLCLETHAHRRGFRARLTQTHVGVRGFQSDLLWLARSRFRVTTTSDLSVTCQISLLSDLKSGRIPTVANSMDYGKSFG
jgi:hypothetical protein